MRSFDNIGYVLESVLTGLELGARTKEHLALILWSDIVGEQIDRITAVQSVRGGVLYVDVEAGAWAQELQFYKPDLIGRINKYIGAEAIQDIYFKPRAVLKRPGRRGKGEPAPTSRRSRSKQPADVQLTLEECQQIEETAARVQDVELREAICSTMSSYRRLERWMVLQGWKRCPECRALFLRYSCPFCLPQRP